MSELKHAELAPSTNIPTATKDTVQQARWVSEWSSYPPSKEDWIF